MYMYVCMYVSIILCIQFYLADALVKKYKVGNEDLMIELKHILTSPVSVYTLDNVVGVTCTPLI